MRKNFGPKAWLYPQPVLIVGTYDENGTPNAMNAAWGGHCDYNEIIMDLAYSHKTVANIKLNKAFTVSIADAAHVTEVDYLGIVSANSVPDKLAKIGITTVKSEFVNAPVIEMFPMTFECKLKKFTDEGVVGEIVNISVDEKVLDENGNIDVSKLQPITYDGANRAYVVLGDTVGKAFSDGKKLIEE